jgi:hypothetical protein
MAQKAKRSNLKTQKIESMTVNPITLKRSAQVYNIRV